MTRRFQPARRAKVFAGVASAATLVVMVAGFEAAPAALATPTIAPLGRSTGVAPTQSPTAPPVPAAEPAPAGPAEVVPVAPVEQAPAPAPDPVVVAPPPAPAAPPVASSGGSGG